jgi:septal ring-binding cell division protein DamX
MVNYSELYGNFNVIVMNEKGETLTSFDLSNVAASETLPTDPNEPIKGDAEEKPNLPDDKQEETPSDDVSEENKTDEQKPDETKEATKDKNLGLLLGIGIAIVVLAAGLITTLIVIKKKNKTNKK